MWDIYATYNLVYASPYMFTPEIFCGLKVVTSVAFTFVFFCCVRLRLDQISSLVYTCSLKPVTLFCCTFGSLEV